MTQVTKAITKKKAEALCLREGALQVALDPAVSRTAAEPHT